jgi:hypothetical protein
MSILLPLGGFVLSAIFGFVGYRLANATRNRDIKKNFTYHGRVQALYDEVSRSGAMSMASILKRAAIARSAPFQVRF